MCGGSQLLGKRVLQLEGEPSRGQAVGVASHVVEVTDRCHVVVVCATIPVVGNTRPDGRDVTAPDPMCGELLFSEVHVLVVSPKPGTLQVRVVGTEPTGPVEVLRRNGYLDVLNKESIGQVFRDLAERMATGARVDIERLCLKSIREELDLFPVAVGTQVDVGRSQPADLLESSVEIPAVGNAERCRKECDPANVAVAEVLQEGGNEILLG